LVSGSNQLVEDLVQRLGIMVMQDLADLLQLAFPALRDLPLQVVEELQDILAEIGFQSLCINCLQVFQRLFKLSKD